MAAPDVARVPPRRRTAVISGASSGIGRAIALALADRGWRLGLVASGATRLEAVAAEIRARSPGAAPTVHPADLALQQEVRRVAASLRAEYPVLDALVNDAGAWFHHRAETAEGVERTWALNVLAPTLLTELLRPSLRAAAPSRVVLVSSAAHRGQHLHLDDLEGRAAYRGFTQYGRSKLALILLTHVLDARYREDGISVNALHPGFIRSRFGQNNPGAVGRGMWLLTRLGGRSPAYGARTPVWLVTAPEAAGFHGAYFVRAKPARSSAASYDAAIAEGLWEDCVRRLHLEPPVPGTAGVPTAP